MPGAVWLNRHRRLAGGGRRALFVMYPSGAAALEWGRLAPLLGNPASPSELRRIFSRSSIIPHCAGAARRAHLSTQNSEVVSVSNFTYRSELPVPAEALHAWHARPGALERLLPPWNTVRVVERSGGISPGARVVMKLRQGPAWVTWEATHRAIDAGLGFVDDQTRGPFSRWVHTHRFEPRGGGSELCDSVEFALPLSAITHALGGEFFVRRMLNGMFHFRHERTRHDLLRHAQWQGADPMKVAIAGASGLVGNQLAAFLTTGGNEVVKLVRGKSSGPGTVAWDPARGHLEPAALEGTDAFVHLSGESVAGGRWTAERKEAIRTSRVQSTALVAKILASMRRKPAVWVCASAIGIYGARGDEPLTESSAIGDGFLAEVCRDWEAACEPARQAGIRVVNLRIGVVLTAGGGALEKMLLPFKLGLGGRVGTGRQVMSWIALDDLLGAFLFCLRTPSLAGPVNATSPNPVPQAEFARALGHVLSRPVLAPLPAFAVRAMFGEMGESLLLEGSRVLPEALVKAGFEFRYPSLEAALRHELGR